MARLARVIAPGFPHHVIQRGNRRQQTFFSDNDYRAYLSFLSLYCDRYSVEVWAYCLMPNHVHLVTMPHDEQGLRQAVGETHRNYTRLINTREGWKGHLWQGRFSSYPMDERYTLAAVRYIETNPVRANLVRWPGDWRWSSADTHLNGKEDGLVVVSPLLDMVGNWSDFLADATDHGGEIRRHENTGRPLGSREFVGRLEEKLERRLRKMKTGPK
jgi:putative transposase